jgi:transcriptional regulator with XRE-family HTH domain
MNMQRFGEKLRILRKRHGVTQRQLAKQFGFAGPPFISDLESGREKPNANLILKVAIFFGVTTDVLMRDELDLDDNDM